MENYNKQEILNVLKTINDMPYEEMLDLLEDDDILDVVSELNGKVPNVKIGRILRRMGMPTDLKGYTYIKIAVAYMMERRCKNDAITKDIYPHVASYYNTRAAQVEGCIRRAIEITWKRGNFKLLDEMFGTIIDPGKTVPTNKKFLTILVEILCE